MEEGVYVGWVWDGVWKRNYESGRSEVEIEYSGGSHRGVYRMWWDEDDGWGGALRKSDEYYDQDSLLHGRRRKWYRDGQFEIDQEWVHGVRMSAKSYWDSGKLKSLDSNKANPLTRFSWCANGQPELYTI